MKFDVTVFAEDLNEASSLATAVEAYGFDGLWVAEAAHNPFLSLAHAVLEPNVFRSAQRSRLPFLAARCLWRRRRGTWLNNLAAASSWAWVRRSSRI